MLSSPCIMCSPHLAHSEWTGQHVPGNLPSSSKTVAFAPSQLFLICAPRLEPYHVSVWCRRQQHPSKT